MDEHEIAYGILLGYLSPVDLASLRRCCRSWKQLVDRTLSSLQPYNLGKLKPHSIYSHIPALYYRLLLSGSNINFISTPQVGSHVFLAIARQFTSLKSLELDCVSKAHLDFGNLRCLPQLTACTLLEFPFNDVAALSDGVGKCRGLTALALQSRKESLSPCRMEHLVHLHHLKSLCLKPRSYSSSPLGASASLTCLGQLTGLTRLQLLAYEQGLRAASPSLDPWEAATPGSPTTAAVGAATFDGAATEYLGAALRSLRGLMELEVCGCATIPPHMGSLAELRRLSIERLDQVNRADVLQLRPLTALTALTLLAVATHPSAHHTALAAAAADDEDPDADAEAAGDIGPAAPSASGLASSSSGTAGGAGGRTNSSTSSVGGAGPSSSMSWTASSIGGVMAPLAELGSLQELVVGTVGMAACQALHGEGPGVTAYVCPLNWDMLSCQGLTHVGVEARGWHSACITAKFPTPEAAQHTLLTWAQQQGMVVTSRSRSPGAGGGPHVYSRHTVHGINVDTLLCPTATAPPRNSMGQGSGSDDVGTRGHPGDFGDALIRRTLSLPRQAMSFDTASLAVATGAVSGGPGRSGHGLPPHSRPAAAAATGAAVAAAATAAGAAAPGTAAAQPLDTAGGSCSHCGASSGSGGGGGGSSSRPDAGVGDGGSSSSDGVGQHPHGSAHRPVGQPSIRPSSGADGSGTGAAGNKAPSVPSSSTPSSNPQQSGSGASDSNAGLAAAGASSTPPASAAPGEQQQRASLPGTLSARNDAAAAIWGTAAARLAGDSNSSSRTEADPSVPGSSGGAAGDGGGRPGTPRTPTAAPAAGGADVGSSGAHLQQAGNSSPSDSIAVSRTGGLAAAPSSSLGSSISSQQVLGSAGSSTISRGSMPLGSVDVASTASATLHVAAAATEGSGGGVTTSSRAASRAVGGASGVSFAATTSGPAAPLAIPSRIQVPSAASVAYSPGPSSATAATSSGAGLGWGGGGGGGGYLRPGWGFPEFSWLDVEPSSELAAAAGVFANHPDRGGYLVGWPQCLTFRMAPGLGKLPAAQRVVLQSLIRQLSLDCPTTRGLRFDSPARRLLQAHHRSSLPPAQVLPRLASISSLRRLDLTVDQHWPSAVLHRIGLLARCQQLTCLHLDCGRRDIPDKFWTGLAQLRRLQWLSLRWLESVPLYRLAPLTALRALQLKDLGKPPGAGELAEVVGDMPMLRYLAIEGALLDVSEDFLARLREVVEGGRYTWVWLEHTLSRRMTLQLLGSITAALLLAVLLPRQRLPEMLLTSLLAAFFAWLLFLGVVLTVVLLVVGEYQGSAWWLPWGKPQRQPGAGLKQLRYLSLRRCTFTNSRRRKAAVSSAKGSTLVGLVRALPDLRFLDVMWLNGHQSELAELLHVPQLHYISIGKQQLGRSWHDAVRACSAVVLEAPGGMDEVLERELSCH